MTPATLLSFFGESTADPEIDLMLLGFDISDPAVLSALQRCGGDAALLGSFFSKLKKIGKKGLKVVSAPYRASWAVKNKLAKAVPMLKAVDPWLQTKQAADRLKKLRSLRGDDMEALELMGFDLEDSATLSALEKFDYNPLLIGSFFGKIFKGISNAVAKLDPTSSTAPLGKIVKGALSVASNAIIPGSGIAVNAALTAAHSVGASMKAKGQTPTPQAVATEVMVQNPGISAAAAYEAAQKELGLYTAPKNPLVQTLTNPIFLAVAGVAIIGGGAFIVMNKKKRR
jgi:hypothetical protein